MGKVTSKRQVTIPKELADRYGIQPGDRIRWIPAGDEIRVVTARTFGAEALTTAHRLSLFDRATERRDRLHAERGHSASLWRDRGWTRDELHDRGRAR